MCVHACMYICMCGGILPGGKEIILEIPNGVVDNLYSVYCADLHLTVSMNYILILAKNVICWD